MAALLLAAAWALPLAEAPLGDEATYLLAAASVWEDGDLRFEREDLVRGYQSWDGGPRGVALVGLDRADRSLLYGRPLLYPVVAAPAYGLLGPRGLRVLNAALYLAVAWCAWRRFVPARAGAGPAGVLPEDRGSADEPAAARAARGRWRAGLLVAGSFLASGAAIRALRFEPDVLLMACVFFAVALWCRVRSEPLWGRRELLPMAAAGLLLAAAAVSEPWLALLALPPAVDLLWARRWKAAAAFVLVLLVAAGALAAGQHQVAGAWGAELAAEARAFAGPFPLEARPAIELEAGGGSEWEVPRAGEVGDDEPGPPAAADLAPPDARDPEEPSPGLRLRRSGWRLFWLATGRHVGLLAYFPFGLFLLGLYLADLRCPGGRSRHLLAGSVLVFLAAAAGLSGSFAAAAAPGAAGASAAGARAAALVYPVLLFLPRRLRGGRALLLPFAAAGLWTLPALTMAASGLASELLLELPARERAYRGLPLELELLAEGRLPGYVAFDRFPEAQGGLWLVPRESFYSGERHPDGVWVRGGTRSEVFVVAREPVEAVRFTAKSIAAESELIVSGDGDRLRARFDSDGKRAGVPVEVRPEPVAEGLGWFLRERPEEERVYRFVLEVTGGAVPARVDPRSGDPRYLGVFLEF